MATRGQRRLAAASGLALMLALLCQHAMAQQGWLIDADSKEQAKTKTPHPARRLSENEEADVSTYRTWFDDWKAYYNKTYVTQAEEDLAFTNFQATMDVIRQINHDDNKPYWASGNAYADKNLTDLQSKLRPPPNAAKIHRISMMQATLPNNRRLLATDGSQSRRKLLSSSVDWCKAGKCTPIKSEGSCGSCWSFAGVAAIESAYLIGENLTMTQLPSFELSVQQVIDCENPANGPWTSNGCNGGGTDETWAYCAAGGLSLASTYTGCASAYNPGTSVQLSGTGSHVTTSFTDFMAAVDRQPVAFYYAVDVTVPDFWFYKGGLFTTDCQAMVNHAMVLTGYNYTGDLSTSEWIVRNAYAATWGENGFMRLPMYPDGNGVSKMYTWGMYPPLTWARILAAGVATGR